MIQQIVTRGDPAAISVTQAQYLTVLYHDLSDFAPSQNVSEIVDFQEPASKAPTGG